VTIKDGGEDKAVELWKNEKNKEKGGKRNSLLVLI